MGELQPSAIHPSMGTVHIRVVLIRVGVATVMPTANVLAVKTTPQLSCGGMTCAVEQAGIWMIKELQPSAIHPSMGTVYIRVVLIRVGVATVMPTANVLAVKTTPQIKFTQK